MKYPAKIYANALLKVLGSSGKQAEWRIIKRFAALLQKNGDLANYGKISSEIERLIARKNGGKFISMEVAQKEGEATKKVANFFSERDIVKVRVLPELLAGARILVDDEREFDFSFKKRLKDLFSK
ncbi:hypothetical protein A3I27_00830 [Candidatus Giovannonibacteria bacterium RIFCSPLOWO2_02_FULL_43_11b]|uniref:F-type ATPase subunit delta n=1 Tax=Candidatus Giovannonibacteria bacterium RIFCSPHIGHO2_12_FULL_43_15 TaxID=1798341 RepID=A0A1F5WNJ9_9BACT|nr:MAG: hypothetical protein A2739_00370 [Candidatus Giovannonibacteria bacterium RIFCSPHIGHO2_01_FULL_43_100]OGF67560.1 MAG: hypothetical protein A3B97_00650 [Candidatus Giovannonibacteria bacterium RIFCSPHIGHO2_02_FULL_43_32]OGF77233.1 MAG: hypothetical protein A3F23_03120 [Candidatus Giovannonibacteria bacterium RIFCSPHIGHO2_12_FULL_43_15]OGF79060.1 MAG: hypothetical protein A3A15_03630 [Candidatus Giovannonibacteria bacterium RIFCSPLOWO2_01_FULL_43_60]OGF89501.1 MAG: hypothetical protein A3